MSDHAEAFHFHIGRSWVGHPLEDDCPCGKAPCGLIDTTMIDPDCPHHAMGAAKTMRQMHLDSWCRASLELVEVDHPMKAQAESMERHADEMLAALAKEDTDD